MIVPYDDAVAFILVMWILSAIFNIIFVCWLLVWAFRISNLKRELAGVKISRLLWRAKAGGDGD
jgi:hypothetical protein